MSTAAERVTHYLAERKRMRALDQEEIHGMNVGDEREAVLTVTDLRELVAIATRADNTFHGITEEVAAKGEQLDAYDRGYRDALRWALTDPSQPLPA